MWIQVRRALEDGNVTDHFALNTDACIWIQQTAKNEYTVMPANGPTLHVECDEDLIKAFINPTGKLSA